MVGDEAQTPLKLEALAPGERRRVELSGPACRPGTVASVQLDPDGRVDESDERNNVRSFACA
jgi:subtilase family serine protease